MQPKSDSSEVLNDSYTDPEWIREKEVILKFVLHFVKVISIEIFSFDHWQDLFHLRICFQISKHKLFEEYYN